MKKPLWIALIVIVVLVVAVVALPLIFINPIIKHGVEAVGPAVAKVEIKLADANLSLWSGKGTLRGFVVGNPEGYKTPSAMSVGEVSVAIQPRSVFSDKVVVESVRVVAPEITFEGGLQGNNLKAIMANVQAASGGATSTSQPGAPAEGAGKKLEIGEFQLTGGQLKLSTGVLGGKSLTLALPDIQLRDLGKGSDGITGAELTRQVLQIVLDKVMPLVADNLGKLGTEAVGAATEKLKEQTKGVEKVTKGLGDLLKK